MPTRQACNLVDGEWPVARVDEHVNAEKRQMDLAIAPDDAPRPDQNARVVEPRSVALEQAEEARAARLRGERRQPVSPRARRSAPRARSPSSRLPNPYPDRAHSGKTASFAPASAAWRSPWRIRSRFSAILPSFGSICTPATRIVSVAHV